ncbi:MAG: SUF system NifU family Fe-S cluster assembly protein [Gemmataceae bacterium]|nr:SUF system NifU family Fe-S cluster assembly protein [Gemmataceae bacterium]MDW8263950.1 SUF system NifU family Fe-S cluster assembly protein [Gemmataceae bacterium]
MSELRDLYQQVILDHYRRPRNFRIPPQPTQQAVGHNPLCGDRVTVYLQLDGDTIRDIAFQGSGCAISMASASMMTENLKGKTVAEAQALFQRFHELVTSDQAVQGPDLGKLAVLAGVREFPVRVKCATLAWHTLRAALSGSGDTVTTE